MWLKLRIEQNRIEQNRIEQRREGGCVSGLPNAFRSGLGFWFVAVGVIVEDDIEIGKVIYELTD